MDRHIINEIKEVVVLKDKNLTITPTVSSKKELPKYWEKEYINNCINKISNYEHKMLMLFLWYSGIRVSEAINVCKKDIDFNSYILTIRWLKSRKYLYRNIPLHPMLRNVLQLYTARLNLEDKIFPLSRQRAWQIVKKYLNGNPHKFRHSFAVNWLKCGGEIVSLSKMLGHVRIQTTMEYLKLVPMDIGREFIKIKFE